MNRIKTVYPMMQSTRYFLLLATFAFASPVFAQGNQISSWLQSLASTDPNVRKASFYALLGASTAGQGTTVAQNLQNVLNNNPSQANQIELALIGTLQTENLYVAQTDAKPTGDLEEDYTDYHADLTWAVASLNDTRGIPALAGSVKSGGMAITALVSFGPAALDSIIGSFNTTDSLLVGALGIVLQKMIQRSDFQSAFQPSDVAKIRSGLLVASSHGDSYIKSKLAPALALLNVDPADVNGDGVVNCLDLGIVKASFGLKLGQPGFDPRADVNGDGIVNILDLAAVAKQLPAGITCK